MWSESRAQEHAQRHEEAMAAMQERHEETMTVLREQQEAQQKQHEATMAALETLIERTSAP